MKNFYKISLKRFLPLLIAVIAAIVIQNSFSNRTNAHNSAINEQEEYITLPGNVHQFTQAERIIGKPEASFRLQEVNLVLNIRNRAELEQLLEDQQNIASPDFHKWLTPEEFGARFGATDREIAEITKWMQGNGLSVDIVQPGRTSITFSGTIEQFERAFHTNFNNYYSEEEGKTILANASNPQIPARFSEVIGGVLGLNGFHKARVHHVFPKNNGINPDFAGPFGNTLAPSDFALAYDLNPLYSAGIDGTGQTIAIIGRTNINLSDVATFRSNVGLPAKAPTVILVSTNPGIVSTDEEGEALLDNEWSGGVAKNATIKFVVGQSTQTTDGIDASLQYVINNNVAPVTSTSFGDCETDLGTSGNQFYNNLYMQGASQGQSIFVSTGDSGAAACFNSSGNPVGPAGVSGLASTPYNVGVGGTSLTGTTFNSSGALTAVTNEVTWNDGTNNGAGGGGASSIYSKPSWQVCTGVPADGKRDIPDVSLQASPNYVGYYYYQKDTGGASQIGGTSASSPSMAGIMALVVQKNGVQGNPNPTFYRLGAAQYNGSGPKVYRDITSGNISQAGVTGPSAGTGYDAATGLGTPDANALVNDWSGTSSSGSVSLSVSPSSQSITAGSSTSYTTTLTRTNFTGSVTLALQGTTPSGLTAAFATNPTTGNSTTLTVSTTSSTPAGTYTFSVSGSASGATVSTSNSFTVTVTSTTSSSVSLSVSPTSQTVTAGSAASYTTTLTRTNFTGSVTLALQGTAPTGLTAAFATNPTTGNSTTLTVSTTSSTPAGTYTFSVSGSASGATVSTSNSFTITVNAASGSASVALSVSPTSRSVTVGASTTYTASLTRTNFTGAVTLSAYYTGATPTGVTYAVATNPTSGNSTTLTFYTSSTTPAGTYTFYIAGTATGATVSNSNTFTLTVTAATPTVNLSVSPTSRTVTHGSSTTYTVSLARTNFTGKVTLTPYYTGATPTGVTYTIATNPTSGNSTTLTLYTSSTTPKGTYTFFFEGTASGATVNNSNNFTLTVQ